MVELSVFCLAVLGIVFLIYKKIYLKIGGLVTFLLGASIVYDGYIGRQMGDATGRILLLAPLFVILSLPWIINFIIVFIQRIKNRRNISLSLKWFMSFLGFLLLVFNLWFLWELFDALVLG
ncbi:hypothetical protein KKA27_01200 [Patescibacteria group bacterium]|nr:hypothetical protein [Patescibacteria group bacterium]